MMRPEEAGARGLGKGCDSECLRNCVGHAGSAVLFGAVRFLPGTRMQRKQAIIHAAT